MNNFLGLILLCGSGIRNLFDPGSASATLRITVKSWIRIRFKVNRRIRIQVQNGAIKGRGRSQWRLKMEPLEGLYDSGAELHHFDEEQDSHLNPQQSDRSDPDRHQSK